MEMFLPVFLAAWLQTGCETGELTLAVIILYTVSRKASHGYVF